MKIRRFYALLPNKIDTMWETENVDYFFLYSLRIPLGLNTVHKE